jgi:hypothetical protein
MVPLNGQALWSCFSERTAVPEDGLEERKERLMNDDRIAAVPELVCADCGLRFRARRVTDGVEEICDGCFEARFPTHPIPQSQHTHFAVRGHLAAD